MYFDELSALVTSGKLRLLFIISPPRTSSTLLETTFSYSPSVSINCHEPFMHVGYSELDPDLGYKAIFDTVAKGGQDKDKCQVVVIKDMASWVSRNDEFKRLFGLTQDPILFLTRNPLLATESRIKKVVQAVSLAPRISTRRGVLDCVETKPQDPEGLSQDELLNYYARSRGSSDWKNFIAHAFQTRNYALLDEVLKFDTHRFAPETSGWQAMRNLINYLDHQKTPYSVVDSTEFRLDPETIVPRICDQFRIVFCEEMINWKEQPKDVGRDQNRPQDMLWYDTLLNSRGIKPPTEIVPRLADFPPEVRCHLQTVDIPIYAEIFGNPRRIEGSGEKMAGIRNIDPLFSVLLNPSLLIDKSFLNDNKRYLEEIKQIARLQQDREGGVRANLDFKGRRI